MKYLRSFTYEQRAIEALENIPFVLWKAENGFGDQFCMLYLKASTSEFIKLVREAETEDGARAYAAIAQGFESKGEKLRFISIDYTESGDAADVETPALKSTSDAVELALENLNTLLQHSSKGPTSAVDRVHTALHAHLIHLCTLEGESPDEGAGLEALFSLLRKHQQKHSTQVDTVLRSLSRVMGALNSFRNDHSLAHPNDALLEEPEAMLVLNTGRTLLRYVDARFSN